MRIAILLLPSNAFAARKALLVANGSWWRSRWSSTKPGCPGTWWSSARSSLGSTN